MSRCTVCNVVLTESELKHKDKLSGRYTDMCTDCHVHHEALVQDNNNTEELTMYVYVEDDGGIDFVENNDEWS